MSSPHVAPPTVAEVTNRLRAVMDPELGDNIVDLGMAAVDSISADGVVAIGMKLTIKGCPLRVQIKQDIEARVGTHPGVSKVTIDWGRGTHRGDDTCAMERQGTGA
jgi:ATP-binding protein involved in chromosome partitioning